MVKTPYEDAVQVDVPLQHSAPSCNTTHHAATHGHAYVYEDVLEDSEDEEEAVGKKGLAEKRGCEAQTHPTETRTGNGAVGNSSVHHRLGEKVSEAERGCEAQTHPHEVQGGVGAMADEDREAGDRAVGDRAVGERVVGERVIRDKAVGERVVGERAVGESFVTTVVAELPSDPHFSEREGGREREKERETGEGSADMKSADMKSADMKSDDMGSADIESAVPPCVATIEGGGGGGVRRSKLQLKRKAI